MDIIFPIVNTLHTLAAVIWVGGMFFAHMALRPALMQHQPETSLTIWSQVLPRFFAWVWGAVIILPLTGYAMVYVDFGSFAEAGRHVELMHALAWVMISLYGFMVFKPYAAFQTAIAEKNWAAGKDNLAIMRRIVTTNLILGIVVIVAGVSGRFWG